MITIFYDGKCGLCSREINYYKKIAQVDKFQWLDIATNPAPLKPLKISQADGPVSYTHLTLPTKA